jgi:hypothetical protein
VDALTPNRHPLRGYPARRAGRGGGCPSLPGTTLTPIPQETLTPAPPRHAQGAPGTRSCAQGERGGGVETALPETDRKRDAWRCTTRACQDGIEDGKGGDGSKGVEGVKGVEDVELLRYQGTPSPTIAGHSSQHPPQTFASQPAQPCQRPRWRCPLAEFRRCRCYDGSVQSPGN